MITINVRSAIILVLLLTLVVAGGVAAVTVKTVGSPAVPAATTGTAPVLVIENSHVMKLANSSVIMIMGAGFPPNEEVRLIISQMDGSISDIGAQVDPENIKANKFGVWGVKWTTGDFAHSALAKAEMYVLQATDANYNVLASAPFGYYDAKAAYDKWPSYARAVIPAPAKTP